MQCQLRFCEWLYISAERSATDPRRRRNHFAALCAPMLATIENPRT